jgi:hypothetical protein
MKPPATQIAVYNQLYPSTKTNSASHPGHRKRRSPRKSLTGIGLQHAGQSSLVFLLRKSVSSGRLNEKAIMPSVRKAYGIKPQAAAVLATCLAKSLYSGAAKEYHTLAASIASFVHGKSAPPACVELMVTAPPADAAYQSAIVQGFAIAWTPVLLIAWARAFALASKMLLPPPPAEGSAPAVMFTMNLRIGSTSTMGGETEQSPFGHGYAWSAPLNSQGSVYDSAERGGAACRRVESEAGNP